MPSLPTQTAVATASSLAKQKTSFQLTVRTIEKQIDKPLTLYVDQDAVQLNQVWSIAQALGLNQACSQINYIFIELP